MGNSQKKTNANEMPITGDLIQIFPSGFAKPYFVDSIKFQETSFIFIGKNHTEEVMFKNLIKISYVGKDKNIIEIEFKVEAYSGKITFVKPSNEKFDTQIFLIKNIWNV